MSRLRDNVLLDFEVASIFETQLTAESIDELIRHKALLCNPQSPAANTPFFTQLTAIYFCFQQMTNGEKVITEDFFKILIAQIKDSPFAKLSNDLLNAVRSLQIAQMQVIEACQILSNHRVFITAPHMKGNIYKDFYDAHQSHQNIFLSLDQLQLRQVSNLLLNNSQLPFEYLSNNLSLTEFICASREAIAELDKIYCIYLESCHQKSVSFFHSFEFFKLFFSLFDPCSQVALLIVNNHCNNQYSAQLEKAIEIVTYVNSLAPQLQPILINPQKDIREKHSQFMAVLSNNIPLGLYLYTLYEGFRIRVQETHAVIPGIFNNPLMLSTSNQESQEDTEMKTLSI